MMDLVALSPWFRRRLSVRRLRMCRNNPLLLLTLVPMVCDPRRLPCCLRGRPRCLRLRHGRSTSTCVRVWLLPREFPTLWRTLSDFFLYYLSDGGRLAVHAEFFPPLLGTFPRSGCACKAGHKKVLHPKKKEDRRPVSAAWPAKTVASAAGSS